MKKDLMIRNSTEELENTKLNIPIEETVENISQTNTDISWVEPYPEEDIETYEIQAKEEKIPKLVRSLKNKHR